MDKNNIKKQSVYISEEEKTLNWEEIQSSFSKTTDNKSRNEPTLQYVLEIIGKIHETA